MSGAEWCWACKGPLVLPDSSATASGQVPLLLANCAASHSALQMPQEDAGHGLVDQSIGGECSEPTVLCDGLLQMVTYLG